MWKRWTSIVLFGVMAQAVSAAEPDTREGSKAECPDALNHEFRRLHSNEDINLCERFGGQPLLVVNTASHCGFTSQFGGLEALHEKYAEQGLAVIGFASNAFDQEADSEEEAATVCYENFGVTFTMLAPTPVTGDDANPVFKELARQTEEPGWNFNKYLVAPDGTVVKHFGSRVKPDSKDMTQAIEQLLSDTQ
ncbi:glutathione peroxidase [Marinimicrobium sp. ARAG 43.8]|uniref:glutathione peroxidase n=1 Tax=Marinimicrobium sp. ARAG 43.8 TaxID=3418719 RepID=UPI003CEFCD66